MSKQDIPIIGPLLNRIIGTRNDRFVKKYNQRVAAINALEPQIRALTDEQLRGKLAEFRARHDKGAKAEDMMIEAFAVAREAMDRGVGIRQVFNPDRHFDPSVFEPRVRALYDETKAKMDAAAPTEPRGLFLGYAHAIEGWRQIDIPLEIYEAVRKLYPESRPPYRARPFDVQLIGAMVLTQGKIAEMRTGEGKTIVGPLATYLAACERLRIHVVTVNDYLVQRDRDWTAPYFTALGLTVGAIHPQHMQDENEKRRMYLCDVVYGTTAEFGFDYLRDNMKRRVEEQVQRRRQFAIVDEVDSILIDEARTPLIISGPAHEDQPRYELADRLARHLVEKQQPWNDADERVTQCQMRIKGLEGDIRQARDRTLVPAMQAKLKEAKAELPKLEAERNRHVQYYEVKLERKAAHLTHDGVAEAQRVAGIGSFYVDQNIDLPHLLEQSLRAHAVYVLDRDYVIMDAQDPNTGQMVPSVVIVDVNTGRPMVGRQWSDGLHQAVECKERVPIKQETQTVATITIQNFFKMYKRLAGMTGTADTEAQEFHDIYKLDVVSIPTNKPVIRRDFDDLVFLSQKDKWNLIVDEIKAFHDVGRPILVGTTSVEKSEMLSRMLTSKYGIKHEVLNAKQHEREAHIVENAGQLGAVMIATNMAGRGTDIKLGGISREAMLEHWLRRGLAPRTLTTASSSAEVREAIYRKIAPQELDLKKKDADEMAWPELEIKLLRHWAYKHTWLGPKEVDSMNADVLRKALDDHGRFLLHRVDWFDTIEQMGGLHVIGTERHEARRIDNQLRGRSGRQGDRGSSRFFVSLEDELMKLFAGETTMKVLASLGMKEGDAIEHPMLSRSVERAQRKVEERNFQIRKHVLEYDEVMEHQRQHFYGLRQRVLEGRDVKGLLLSYIEESTQDAVAEYLDPEYPSQCIGEFVRGKLDATIPPDRFRGRSEDEIAALVRKEAKNDARTMIDMHLGEYIPMEGSEVSVDFDAAGLANWAKSRFNVDIDPASLRAGGAKERKQVFDMLFDAACERIDTADLTGVEGFLAPNFGASQLSRWVQEKFGMQISVDEIIAAHKAEESSATELIMKRARELYQKREAEYPIDYAMEMTMLLMRQSPGEAAAHLAAWGRIRYGLDWTPESVMKTPPMKIRETLANASREFVTSGKLDAAIAEAQKCATDDELDAHLKAKYNSGWPEPMRYLEPDERPNAIRSRVENILRAELLQFERMIMIETLDSTWRDHLYAMDQLRDSINFRAFSQQDPRIEYKREGSHMFKAMNQTVRDRVTDYVFKAKISPQLPAPMPAMGGPGLRGPGAGPAGGGGQPRPPMPPPPPSGGGEPSQQPPQGGQQPRPSGPSSTISGPGFDSVIV
ncbi:MAG: preprotein translocase subunit SecA [Planctomycetota bacterium]|nr:preprotein translocase subunit SecA [Planctomycetota bacterium]